MRFRSLFGSMPRDTLQSFQQQIIFVSVFLHTDRRLYTTGCTGAQPGRLVAPSPFYFFLVFAELAEPRTEVGGSSRSSEQGQRAPRSWPLALSSKLVSHPSHCSRRQICASMGFLCLAEKTTVLKAIAICFTV